MIDPTKPAYIFGGYAPIGNCGNNMRWCVEFRNEYFGTLQGVQMIGFS